MMQSKVYNRFYFVRMSVFFFVLSFSIYLFQIQLSGCSRIRTMHQRPCFADKGKIHMNRWRGKSMKIIKLLGSGALYILQIFLIINAFIMAFRNYVNQLLLGSDEITRLELLDAEVSVASEGSQAALQLSLQVERRKSDSGSRLQETEESLTVVLCPCLS